MWNNTEYTWRDGKKLTISNPFINGKCLIMGILNITPDSFSDGGRWNTLDRAITHMKDMVAAGADIIDIGAESSRPGFIPMSSDEEIKRLEPFLEALLAECPVPVSVDTFKSKTAAFAARKGAHIINDIWGLQYADEPEVMAKVVAEYDLPVVVMHNQNGTSYDGDIIENMQQFFRNSIDIAISNGVKRSNIILDPGIGFGKTPQANLVVLNRLEELKEIDGIEYPMLLGTSRKSFIGYALDLPVEKRVEPTGATCVMGLMKGCEIMRIHDVASIAPMLRITEAILQAK